MSRTMDGTHISRIGAGIQNLKRFVSGLSSRHVQTLCLHANQISRIEGLQVLQGLREANLSSNAITRLEGLQALTALSSLNVASNRLSSIDNLERLPSLEHLNLSYNSIAHLSGLSALQVYLSIQPSARLISITMATD